MKLLKNKKAKYFITMVCVFLIISLGVFLYFVEKNLHKSNRLGYIGQKSNNLLESYQKAEKTLFYIDTAAKYSAPEAFFMTAYEGAMPDDSSCGRYYNFAIWDIEDEKCLPMNDKNNNENFKSSFESKMNKALDNYFKLVPELEIPLDNYKINIFEEAPKEEFSTAEQYSMLEQNKKIVVAGDTRTPLFFRIENPSGDIYYVLPSNFPLGPVGKTAKERIKFIIDTYGPIVKKYCEPLEIPESLMVALIYKESGGNRFAISATGCAGLNQFCYGTAKEYANIFEILTPCNCEGENCKYGIAACSEANDNRFDPEKSIHAGCVLLSNYIKQFEGKTSKVDFGLAAYNGGPETIKEAITLTGKTDPSWQEVSVLITPEFVKSRGFDPSKSDEIRNYVLRIKQFEEEAEKQISGAEKKAVS